MDRKVRLVTAEILVYTSDDVNRRIMRSGQSHRAIRMTGEPDHPVDRLSFSFANSSSQAVTRRAPEISVGLSANGKLTFHGGGLWSNCRGRDDHR
jgi:hypothetical protein